MCKCEFGITRESYKEIQITLNRFIVSQEKRNEKFLQFGFSFITLSLFH